MSSDRLTKTGANRLANTIREYWANLGYEVGVEVVQERVGSGEGSAYVVRTDLVNGLPRGSKRDVWKKVKAVCT